MIQLPADWSSEVPELRALVVEPLVMVGEDWYGDGRHRRRVRMVAPAGELFATLEAAARKAGVRAQRNKSVGWLELEGKGWHGTAMPGGGAHLALGTQLQLFVDSPVEPERTHAGALALARRFDPFVPFANLAEHHGAALVAAVRLEFADAVFGYVEIYKQGLRSFLSSELAGWLAQAGFARRDRDWTLGGSPPLLITVSHVEPDKLRVDVAGLAAYEARPAA